MESVQRLDCKNKIEFKKIIKIINNMDRGEIYLITNKINNKRYVGQTVSILSSGRKYGSYNRLNKHFSDAKNNVDDCKVFCNAIRKYGKSNFKIEILMYCNKDMLDFYETEFIKFYNTISPHGYNIESGGSANKILHEDTKIKLSKKLRFLNVCDGDRNNILKAMHDLNITEIPYGINYTHHIKNKYEGFTVKKNNGKLKSIISNGKTLTEKLSLSIKYLNFIKDNNVLCINIMDKQFIEDSKIIIRNKKLPEYAKMIIKKTGFDINLLPSIVRYKTKESIFYLNIDKKIIYFSKDDTTKSLQDIIEYLQSQRGSVLE